ncbi:hypothetical protein CLV58_1071 [Spirosoma oryzae]|uniref:TMF family protein n=1 Tax=Spirosoma oryzae TaxID=1469603 RepID=A0A2T0T2J6_9BACT|nr:hypothetical protein [Spirosoma oryzae]PRY39908.1 hypothetical protein CLV58_1071 [Spirosoma oryzae]
MKKLILISAACVACTLTVAVAQQNIVVTNSFVPTPGLRNTLVGPGAGANMTQGGGYNVAIGDSAGANNTTATTNVYIGGHAGTGSKGATALNNVAIGAYAGYSISTGSFNLFLGNSAGGNTTSGQYNTFIGNVAGGNNTIGRANTYIGDGAGYASTVANNNLMIGTHAGFNTTTGGSNVMIGNDVGTNNTVGAKNTFIGDQAGSTSGNLTNASAFGANALVSQNNSLILGSPAVRVGIGNSAPQNKLEITEGTSGNSGLRFTNLTSAASTIDESGNKFLSVDASGNVVLRNVNSSLLKVSLGLGLGLGTNVNTDIWSLNNQVVQTVSDNAVAIGTGITSFPAGYRLYVAGGILSEKVKVAIKSSGDWADYVFADTYRLKSLPELEQFIKLNKHLPGIPTSDEMVTKGLDVAKMNAKLLEKIEELTLYMINQHNVIEQVRQENKRLKEKFSTLEATINR